MPIDYFGKMLPDDILEEIAQESDMYATLKRKANFALTLSELKVFLGINFAMTYLQYSRIKLYWASKHGTRLSIIADHMTKHRFFEIRQHFHFVPSNDHHDSKDKLFKIRPLLDHFSKMYADSCDPEEYLQVDEMMIPFKGRSKIKQYVRGKPHPWGIKS